MRAAAIPGRVSASEIWGRQMSRDTGHYDSGKAPWLRELKVKLIVDIELGPSLLHLNVVTQMVGDRFRNRRFFGNT